MQMLQEISGKVREEYRKHLTSKLLLVDALLVFAFSTGIIQVNTPSYEDSKTFAVLFMQCFSLPTWR